MGILGCSSDNCEKRDDYKNGKSNIETKKNVNVKKLEKFILDLNFFTLPERNKFSFDDLLKKKIIYLYLGFHPFNCGPSILFHVFFYICFANPREGVIVEYGKFEDEKQANENQKDEKQEIRNEKQENEKNVNEKKENLRCHFWGKDGLTITEKSPKEFENELHALTYKLSSKKNIDFNLNDWVMCFSQEESNILENLTLGKFLNIVASDKKEWESKAYSVFSHNCITFGKNVVNKLKLNKDEEEIKKYSDFLKNIGTGFSKFENSKLNELFEELKNNKNNEQ